MASPGLPYKWQHKQVIGSTDSTVCTIFLKVGQRWLTSTPEGSGSVAKFQPICELLQL